MKGFSLDYGAYTMALDPRIALEQGDGSGAGIGLCTRRNEIEKKRRYSLIGGAPGVAALMAAAMAASTSAMFDLGNAVTHVMYSFPDWLQLLASCCPCVGSGAV